MIRQTYKDRKILITWNKQRERGGHAVTATVNGGPGGVYGSGITQEQALTEIRADIDAVDREPVNGSRWAAYWYAPGTYELCLAGHAKVPGEPCRGWSCQDGNRG